MKHYLLHQHNLALRFQLHQLHLVKNLLRLIHLVLLVGFHNRVLVFLSWAFAYVSFTKGSRIITGDIPSRIVRPLGNRDGNDPAERARAMELLKGRM